MNVISHIEWKYERVCRERERKVYQSHRQKLYMRLTRKRRGNTRGIENRAPIDSWGRCAATITNVRDHSSTARADQKQSKTCWPEKHLNR